MPSLEHLRCCDDAYFVFRELPIPLKSLRYTVIWCGRPEIIVLHDLMKAKSVIGVEELTLRFTLPLVYSVHMVYKTVRMENLRSFTVEFLTRAFNEATRFFEYLDLPALEVFKFRHDRSEVFSTGDTSDEDLVQPYLRGLNWLLVDYCTIRKRYPKLKEVHITIDGVGNEKLCDKLRIKLDEKFRIEWFGGDLGVTDEGEYAEVVGLTPRVRFWIRPRLVLRQSR
jgi:hypothetical protein